MRRLFTAPRVILLVALIGAAQLLLFFQLILPDVTQVRPYPTAFSKSWEIGGVIVRSEELTVLVVIPVLVVALSLFVNRTKYGLAIRASAANADAARLAAVNIKQMSTLVWVLAGTLAATAAMLFAPLNPAGASSLGVGPGLLLRVLTVALIAGMASMPLALASGVAIGMTESLINYNYNDQRGLLDALLFVVVLVTLLAARSEPRARRSRQRPLVVRAAHPPGPRDAGTHLVGAAAPAVRRSVRRARRADSRSSSSTCRRSGKRGAASCSTRWSRSR